MKKKIRKPKENRQKTIEAKKPKKPEKTKRRNEKT
jgi:hypothetical protein